MRSAKIKLLAILILTLVLCMSVFSMTAYASNGNETLTVNAAWVDGELLRINVTDINGVSSALALRLSDYVNDTENKEFISIQAVDLAGNMSGIIEIKNPFYDPTAAPVIITPPTVNAAQSSESSIQSGIQQTDGSRPFTPDGTGTVVDNVHDGDGKEFFTIGTEDGNVFYIIVDRQRNSDNVYLLNAVTEEDLISLAQAGGREVTPSGGSNSVSAIEIPGNPGENEKQEPPSATEPPSETPEIEQPAKNDNTMYLIIGIAVLAVGGAGYYFKIVRGKKNAVYNDDDEDEADDDEDYGYNNESGGDDDDDLEDGGDEE